MSFKLRSCCAQKSEFWVAGLQPAIRIRTHTPGAARRFGLMALQADHTMECGVFLLARRHAKRGSDPHLCSLCLAAICGTGDSCNNRTRVSRLSRFAAGRFAKRRLAVTLGVTFFCILTTGFERGGTSLFEAVEALLNVFFETVKQDQKEHTQEIGPSWRKK